MSFADGAGDYAASALGALVPPHPGRGSGRRRRIRRLQPLPGHPRRSRSPSLRRRSIPAPRGSAFSPSPSPPTKLSALISYRTGLGETGDTMVVAVDGTAALRTRPMTPEDDVLQPTIFDADHQGSRDRCPGRHRFRRLPRPARPRLGRPGRCHPQPELGPRLGDGHRRGLRPDHPSRHP